MNKRIIPLLLLLLLMASMPHVAAAQVTSNILTRIFPIRVGDVTGSSFTLEVDGRQYLVTARHIVTDVTDGGTISLLREGRWTPYVVKRLSVEPFEADVAVLALPSVLPQTLPIRATYGGLTLAEDLYFLGFPYGLSLPGVLQQSGFPFPFVKRGICSAFGKVNNVDYVFLDGHNNAGFSGGPIVRCCPGANPPTIVGVVSGFRHQDEPIIKEGKPTDYMYRANTGIIVGVAISHVLQAISKRPIGPVAATE